MSFSSLMIQKMYCFVKAKTDKLERDNYCHGRFSSTFPRSIILSNIVQSYSAMTGYKIMFCLA